MDPRIERTAEGYRLECRTVLPRPLDEVFPFFADCRNLERITPPDLRFSILTPDPIVMREGLRIDYRIRLGPVPMRWLSEITAWEPPHRFVDVQLSGPYRRWIHEHTFRADGGTTHMTDRVDFLSPGGRLAHELFINRKVRGIFRHRSEVFAELFPAQERRAD
ncbi:SRPBCC family protein [bacterium]|nr:SRPBCC family protein [bacterium]